MNEQKVVDYYFEKNTGELEGMTVGLIGSLGAGKTYLVKDILTRISSEFENQVTSPTFNLCNIYKISNFEVHHFDLYRIDSEEDLYDIEIWESIENKRVLNFIEWVDLFPDLFDKCDEIVTISLDDNDYRKYRIDSDISSN